jgi:hypothetical protein
MNVGAIETARVTKSSNRLPARTRTVSTRVTEAEYVALREQAWATGKTVCDRARECITEHLEKGSRKNLEDGWSINPPPRAQHGRVLTCLEQATSGGDGGQDGARHRAWRAGFPLIGPRCPVELGGDLRQMNPERTPHLSEGAVERPVCPLAVMVRIEGHLPAIYPDSVQELPAGCSHSPKAGRKPGTCLVFAYLLAEEVTDFQNRTDAVVRNFQLVGGIKHATVFQECDCILRQHGLGFSVARYDGRLAQARGFELLHRVQLLVN